MQPGKPSAAIRGAKLSSPWPQGIVPALVQPPHGQLNIDAYAGAHTPAMSGRTAFAMDHELKNLIKQAVAQSGKTTIETRITHDELGTPTLHFTLDGQERTYAVKPLLELYGPGVEAATFDPASDEYIQLCTDIEMAIVKRQIAFDDLSDAQVLLALDRLNINPEATMDLEDVGSNIQRALRVCLSLDDYSRRDVQRALRKIAKSVQRHTRADGPYGYLTFITKILGNEGLAQT